MKKNLKTLLTTRNELCSFDWAFKELSRSRENNSKKTVCDEKFSISIYKNNCYSKRKKTIVNLQNNESERDQFLWLSRFSITNNFLAKKSN